MAVDIRPTYAAKLRYALKYACAFGLVVPAFFISSELSIERSRWESFAFVAVLLTFVPLVTAVFWAAHVAEIPRSETTWRQMVTWAASYSALIIGSAVLPYFRYTYVHDGTTIVRVDRLTGVRCAAPFFGSDCGDGAPYDPILIFDERTKTWKASPDGKTVRDRVTGG
jgi:hypothetical protein